MLGLKKWTLYIVECSNKTFYTGWTRSLRKELIKINTLQIPYFWKNPKLLPVKVVFLEKNVSFLEAYAKFCYLREMNRYLKMKLIRTKEWPTGGAWEHFINKETLEV